MAGGNQLGTNIIIVFFNSFGYNFFIINFAVPYVPAVLWFLTFPSSSISRYSSTVQLVTAEGLAQLLNKMAHITHPIPNNC